MAEEKKGKNEMRYGGVNVEAMSPESMEKFANAMKEAPILRLRETLAMEAAIDKISADTIDKMDKLMRASAGNGGCGIGCWGAAMAATQ